MRLPPAWRVALICSGVMFAMFLLHHPDAHGARRTRQRTRRLLDVIGIEVCELELRDLTHLIHRHLTDVGTARFLRTGARLPGRLQTCGLLQEEARRRRLHHESERAVGIYGDLHRNWCIRLDVLSFGVECLAEFHDINATLTERRADRR